MSLPHPMLNPLVKRLGTESAFTVLARAASLGAQGKDIINLGIGQPDFQTPDFIVEAAVKAVRDGHHGYTPAKGLPSLRGAVAQDFEIRNGVPLNLEQVLIVPGGKVTMAFAMMLLGGTGSEILYPDPGFPIYGSMAAFSGARPVPYALDVDRGDGLNAELVLSKITPATRLLILNSPANPTGAINDPEQLRLLAQGLEAWPHVTVLSDEIYSRLYFDDAKHLSLMAFENLRDRTIILDGWSKTYAMTGWRLGWSYWPKALIDHAERLAINIHSCVNAPTQVAGQAALEGPQDSVEIMRQAFAARRDLFMEKVAAIPGLSAPKPKGAFYGFMSLDAVGRPIEAVQNALLEDAGVAVIAGTSFGAVGGQHLRVSFANSPENVSLAMDRIGDWLATQQLA